MENEGIQQDDIEGVQRQTYILASKKIVWHALQKIETVSTRTEKDSFNFFIKLITQSIRAGLIGSGFLEFKIIKKLRKESYKSLKPFIWEEA